MTWTFPCDDENCEGYVREHRPYANERKRPPSITELAEVAGADPNEDGEDYSAFTGAGIAAGEIAFTYTFNNYETLAAMPFEEACRKAKIIPKIQWDGDAKLGTLTHEAGHAFANGYDFYLPDTVHDAEVPRLTGFITGLSRFFEDHDLEVLASEFVVARQDPAYVGTGDAIVLMDGTGEPTYVDYKTHRRHKADRSKSFAKWDMQCQLIGLATHLRHYHGFKFVGEVPWTATDLPRPERAVIVSIEADGSYREFETQVDPDNLPTIAGLVAARTWRPTMRQVVSNVVPIPKRPDAPVSLEAML